MFSHEVDDSSEVGENVLAEVLEGMVIATPLARWVLVNSLAYSGRFTYCSSSSFDRSLFETSL